MMTILWPILLLIVFFVGLYAGYRFGYSKGLLDGFELADKHDSLKKRWMLF